MLFSGRRLGSVSKSEEETLKPISRVWVWAPRELDIHRHTILSLGTKEKGGLMRRVVPSLYKEN